ncbi:MAG: FAD binding domain-containing protein [Pseudomonadota bacterium]
MDLNTIHQVAQPVARGELPPFSDGDAFVGGGTWLFSEPQPHLRRLIDLSSLGWQALRIGPDGVEIAATCTLAELNAAAFPAHWPAASLVAECCRCLMGSFKVWNMATVGGNLCMSLPAGPMISLAAGLDATCLIWSPDGTDRRVSLFDFITGPRQNALRPGEVLRSIHLPASALARRAEMRRASLTRLGRSAALLIGTRGREDGAFTLAVTAAVPRPQRFHFPGPPDAAALRARLEAAIPPEGFYDDIHGAPAWRRHMTLRFAEEIRHALCEGTGQ